MPFCGECGTFMPDSAAFCPECGTKNLVLAAFPAAGPAPVPGATPQAIVPPSPLAKSTPGATPQATVPPSPLAKSTQAIVPPSPSHPVRMSVSPRPSAPARAAPRVSAPTKPPPAKPPPAAPAAPAPAKSPTSPSHSSSAYNSGPPPAPGGAYSGGPPPAPGKGGLTADQAAMELSATLLTLQKMNKDLDGPPVRVATVAATGPKPKGSLRREWCMQLDKSDLKGEGVFSEKTVRAVRILMKLFSFFDADMLFIAAEVCKQWNVISEADSLWETVKALEPARIAKALDGKRRRYLRMEKIHVRVHTPARCRRPKDYVINVRKHSKLWSDEPMEFRGFWAKQAKESRTAQILAKDHERAAAATYHTEGDIKCIVIDNGSAFIKAGFSAEKSPSLVIPSLLAYQDFGQDKGVWKDIPQLHCDSEGNVLLHAVSTYGSMVGPEVHNLAFSSLPTGYDAKTAELKQPLYRLNPLTLQSDEKQVWEDWGNVWSYVFNSLQVPGSKTVGVDPTQHPVLITQPIYAARFVREKFTQMLFEQFNVPAVHIAWAPVASAYGYDIKTGLCLDIGESSAQIVPIFEGTIVDTAMKRVAHLGGHQLSQYLIDNLHIRAVDWFPGTPPAVKYDEPEWRRYQLTSIMRNIKERLGRVAPFGEYLNIVETKDLTQDFQPNLPFAKQKTTPIGREAYDCGEIYFAPKQLLDDRDTSIVSLPEMIKLVVDACPLDIREKILGNIVLSGGGSEMPGFYERLEAELKNLYRDTSVLARAVSVKALLDRKHRVWIGGAELARLGMGADHVWLTRDVYEEYGPWGPES